mgnify:CR=1 FL=1
MKHDWFSEYYEDGDTIFQCGRCGERSAKLLDEGCYADRTDVEGESGTDRRGSAFESAKAESLKRPEASGPEAVNRPAHYTGGSVECIDAIESAVRELDGVQAFHTGQIIKYVWRWHKKGGVEDLRKAEWYLKRLIARETV